MADVDAKLAASLKQAKTSLMFFVFVAKGNEGKLLVDKKKISPKDTAEAKKECGGGTIYKGRCKGEEGKLVFEVGKEVPVTVPPLTKKIIKQSAGLTFEVEYHVAADLAAEESHEESAGETSGAAPAAAAPATPAAPAARGAPAAAPPAPIAPPAPAAPPATAGPAQDLEADWLKAHAEIEPAYLQGVRDHPDKATALRGVMGFAQGKAEKRDFHGAIAALKKLADELGKPAASAPTAPAPTGAGVSQSSDLSAALADWKDVRAEVVEDLRQLAGAVAKTPHPKLKEAIIKINAIIKNLTPEPATLQQVNELERYLTQDDVVSDVSDLAFDMREPLLESLQALKPQLQG